jgi:hypothetical protein
MPSLHEGGVYEPRSKRCCTDIIYLVLLLAVWIAMGTVGATKPRVDGTMACLVACGPH